MCLPHRCFQALSACGLQWKEIFSVNTELMRMGEKKAGEDSGKSQLDSNYVCCGNKLFTRKKHLYCVSLKCMYMNYKLFSHDQIVKNSPRDLHNGTSAEIVSYLQNCKINAILQNREKSNSIRIEVTK